MKQLFISIIIILSLVLFGCDILGIGGDSKKNNSYFKFEINEMVYDTRVQGSAFAGIYLYPNGNTIMHTNATRLATTEPNYTMEISIRFNYNDTKPRGRLSPTDSVLITNSRFPNLSLYEGAGDVLIDIYRPIVKDQNKFDYAVLDTLGSRYIKGTVFSYMAREKLSRNGTLPDTFRVEQGEFFIEIVDYREE